MNEADSIQEIKERLVKIETLLENMTKLTVKFSCNL